MFIRTDRKTWSMLVDAFQMQVATRSGNWSQVISFCVNDCLKGVSNDELDHCADRLAGMFTEHTSAFPMWGGSSFGDLHTFEFDPAVAVGVIDLYQRMLAGQWNRLADYRELNEPFDMWSLDWVRASYTANSDLRRTNCSLSASSLSDSGRRAYNAWHRLGGGMPDRGDMRVDGDDFEWEVLDI